MRKEDYLAHEFLPRHLSKEQIADPYGVINDFFSMDFLPAHRRDLASLLKMTVTGDFNKMLNRKERSDLVYFHSWLEKVLEALHIIYEERGNKKVSKKKK
jgi:hypothetical protein